MVSIVWTNLVVHLFYNRNDIKFYVSVVPIEIITILGVTKPVRKNRFMFVIFVYC